MKRHVLAGFFGDDDDVEIACGPDEQLTKLEFMSRGGGYNFGIGSALADLAKIGMQPSETGFDLVVLAAHVHAADTRISRKQESQDSWTREIRLVVPVGDPERWYLAAETLTKALNFLTGDIWLFGFRPRIRLRNGVISPATPLLPAGINEVRLFSGGLDSLIGAINSLESGKTPLLVSHAGEGATSDAQGELSDALRLHYGDTAFHRLRVWMSFPNGLVDTVQSEDSTRGRSFLFFSLGIFAASGLAEGFVLNVPENGLIALNVPLDPLRLGSNSTRTTHPYYMARWNELLTQLGIPGRVENPFWDQTKGEMAADCSNPEVLQSLVPKSLSCSSPAKGRWQGLGVEHCGYCLPCLIRRAALESAFGSGNDQTRYSLTDLHEFPLDTNESSGKQVRSFQVAISRLIQNPELAKLLIHKPGPLSDELGNLERWSNVYQRGLEEVSRLIDGVVTKPK